MGYTNCASPQLNPFQVVFMMQGQAVVAFAALVALVLTQLVEFG